MKITELLKSKVRGRWSRSSLASKVVQANDLMIQGQLDQAIEVWESIIAMNSPEMPHGVWARLVSAHRKSNNIDAVLSVALRAKKARETTLDFHKEVATALVNAKREGDAIKHLLDAADETNDREQRAVLLSRITTIEAKRLNLDVSVRNLQELIDGYYSPLAMKEIKAAAAFTAKQAHRFHARDQWEIYWNRRKNYVYLHVSRRLIEILAHSATAVADIGSNRSPILEYFGAKQTKYSVDITNPYRATDVVSVKEDFYEWQPPEPLQVGTCLQVIEHVSEPQRFCRRMLEVFEISIISVPYLEPSGVNPGHINNDIDLSTVTSWFGKKPNFHYIAKELSGDERLICVFDRATDDEFSNLHKEGQTAQNFMYRWSMKDFS